MTFIRHLLICLFFGCLPASAYSEVDIREGRIYYRGVNVNSSLDIQAENYNQEGAWFVQESTDPAEKSHIFEIHSASGKVEVWLYFTSPNKNIFRVTVLPTDYDVRWLEEDYFILERRHMGLSDSIIFKTDQENGPVELFSVENLIAFSPESKIYAFLDFENDMGKDEVHIKCINSQCKKVYDFDVHYDFSSDILGSIKSASINEKVLTLKISGNDKRYTFSFNKKCESESGHQ